jgi:hypothetical protein
MDLVQSKNSNVPFFLLLAYISGSVDDERLLRNEYLALPRNYGRFLARNDFGSGENPHAGRQYRLRDQPT